MELKRLNIRNFLGIGEGAVTFDQAGVVLIEGVNHDSPSSVSNGAGKSSVFEALYWVLYGKTKRGLVGDDVVNGVAGKNCVVELEFDDFRVVRARRDETLGTCLKFFQNGEGEWKELTLGTVRDTQKLIEETIKLSELSFSRIAYFGQGDVGGFAGLSDAELKRVFEQALGLTFFGEYQERVRSHRAARELSAGEKEASLWAMRRERNFIGEKIELIERSIAQHEKRIEEQRKRLEGELEELSNRMAEIEANALKARRDHEARLKANETNHGDRERLLGLKGRVGQSVRTAADSLVRQKTLNAGLSSRLRSMEGDIREIERKVGRPCGQCGKLYEHADLDAVSVSLEKEMAVCGKSLSEGRDAERRFQKRLGRLEGLAGRVEADLGRCESMRADLAGILARREYWEKELTERIPALFRMKAGVERELRNLSGGDVSDLKDELEFQSQKLSLLIEHEARLEEEIHVVRSEMETARALEEILGNGGLKSYVFDSVTPRLNTLIDRNIKKLDDIDIEVSTVTRLKSGEFREKFAINVHNRHGAPRFEGNSGGEMQKINLAISLAINTLIRTVSEGSINAIFLDECFENLDEGSSERVLDLIREIDTPNVFLITHRSAVKGLVPTVLRVEKRGGAATVR